ncbi:hypothetical protein BJF78_21485 [Pseudonocardia sp. CNS-139]|nr:hypothetical protein BJF78_21485 [Pseudonocardia sp. CNS-139]
MAAMPVVSSHRSALTDLVRSTVVALFAVLQVLVAALAGRPIGEVARQYATPLLPAGWAFAVWVPIYAGFLAYAVYQLLPQQRGREVHRETGWWLVASAVFNAGWVLAFGSGLVPLAELLVIALLVTLAVVFGRLTRAPAESLVERVVLRGTVAVYTGWVSLAIVVGTAATGAWLGLPARARWRRSLRWWCCSRWSRSSAGWCSPARRSSATRPPASGRSSASPSTTPRPRSSSRARWPSS